MLRDDSWLPLSGVGCDKSWYTSRKQARRVGRRLVHGHDGRMRAYQCDYCGYWHVGHLPELVVAGQLTYAEYKRLARRGSLPAIGQRPVDMTGGVLLPKEVAEMFGVDIQAVYAWARAYQTNDPDHAQLEAFLTPGNQWRFSRKAAEAARQGDQDG